MDEPIFYSEDIEPFRQHIIGRLFAKCAAAKETEDPWEMRRACQNLWFGVKGLRKIGIACSNGAGPTEQMAFYNNALSSDYSYIVKYILEETGIDPLKDWKNI